jgi:tetratricopeptide (TPR) repeat protein
VAQNAQPVPRTTGTTLQVVSLTIAVLALNLRLMVSGLAQEEFQSPSVNKLIEFFILLPILFYLLAGALSGKLLLRKSGVTIPLAAFTGLALLSVFQASDFAASYRFALTLLFHSAFFFLLFHLCLSQKIEKIVLSALLSSVGVICFIALYQYFFGLEEVRKAYHQHPELATVSEQMRRAYEERLSQNEVFATFFLSNTLCSFLAIALPIPLLLFLSRLKKVNFKWGNSAILAFLSVIILIAIVLTKSKGGWLALIASLFLTALYYLRLRRKRSLQSSSFWRTAAIALACIIFLFLFTPLLSWVRLSTVRLADLLWGTRWANLPVSLCYRLDYWAGTRKMILSNPFGVGAANSPDYYPLYKLPYAGEVKLAHNSYLTICAELGILALLAYLAIWFSAARRLLKPIPNASKTVLPESDDFPVGGNVLALCAMLGGVLSFTLLYHFGPFFNIPYSLPREVVLWGAQINLPEPLLLAVLWLILFVLISRKTEIFDSPVLPLALAAGLGSFLLHSMADFDFSCHGINLTVLVILSLLLAHHLRKKGLTEKVYVAQRLVLVPLVSILSVLIIIFALFYLPGRVLADYLRQDAAQTRLEADLDYRDALLTLEKAKTASPNERKMCTDLAGTSVKSALAHLSDAAVMLEKAKSAAPDERKMCMDLAGIYQYMLSLLRSQIEGERDQKRIEDCFDKAVRNYSAASHLAPLTHSAFYNIALLYISHSDPLTKSDADRAFEAAKEAVRIYPTRPQYHVLLGALYRGKFEAEGGEKTKEKMLFHFTEALRLSKEAPHTNYWLKFTESERREIEELLRYYGK